MILPSKTEFHPYSFVMSCGTPNFCFSSFCNEETRSGVCPIFNKDDCFAVWKLYLTREITIMKWLTVESEGHTMML